MPVVPCLMLALALSATVSALPTTRPPCPSGLQCASGPSVPQAQVNGYLGVPLACPLEPYAPLSLCAEHSFFFSLIQTRGYTLTLETPYLIRWNYLFVGCMANALTAFHPTALPYAYAPGYGLPYATRISGEANNTCNKNTALAYAAYTIGKKLVGAPPALMTVFTNVMTQTGLDPNYVYQGNLTDPRDIGIAAALAVTAYGQNDGWNNFGLLPDGNPAQAQNYSDYTNFVPANTPYELTDITKWQPLLEDNNLGYFVAQTHVAAQVQSKMIEPFSLPRSSFYTKYNIDTRPYPSALGPDALAAYKAQADQVIQTQATLNDTQKLITELFDQKINGFVATPYRYYYKLFNWTLDDLVNYAAFQEAMQYDATLVTWSLKPKLNAVRPVSAIRYLYANTNITAWAGPYQGVKSFPGRKFNSYLRTMPHADYPSGTSCVCIAWAKFTERYLNRIDTMPYQAKFIKGCSLVEPGTVPATNITFTTTTTQDFINICAQTRLWAGVHFQQSIDAALQLCSDLGIDGYNRYLALRAGTDAY